MDIDDLVLTLALLLFFYVGMNFVKKEDQVVRYLRKHGQKP